MKAFKTDENNDLFLDGTHNIAMCEDIEAVAQVCSNVVKCQLGELQFDVERGVPYLETIFAEGGADVPIWKSYMIEALEKVDGVQSVSSFETEIVGDVLKYTAQIETIYGTATITG